MSSHTDAIDERDLGTLRGVHDLFSRADPMPAGLTDRLKFAISVHALHAEVAELMDSALLATRGAESQTVSEPTPTESVTFTAASVSLMITASPTEDDRRVKIDGWVTKGGAEVDAVTSEGTVTVVADEHGRFVIDSVGRGAVHFVVRTNPGDADARPVVTPTVEL